jgi:hypothetical protein
MKIYKISQDINEEFQTSLDVLNAYDSNPQKPIPDQLLDILGTEEYPRYVRESIKNIVFFLEDSPTLAINITPNLDKYFSSYSERYTPKYIREHQQRSVLK